MLRPVLGQCYVFLGGTSALMVITRSVMSSLTEISVQKLMHGALRIFLVLFYRKLTKSNTICKTNQVFTH